MTRLRTATPWRYVSRECPIARTRVDPDSRGSLAERGALAGSTNAASATRITLSPEKRRVWGTYHDPNDWTTVRPANGGLRSRPDASQAALGLRMQLRRRNDGISVVAPCEAVALLRLS